MWFGFGVQALEKELFDNLRLDHSGSGESSDHSGHACRSLKPKLPESLRCSRLKDSPELPRMVQRTLALNCSLVLRVQHRVGPGYNAGCCVHQEEDPAYCGCSGTSEHLL